MEYAKKVISDTMRTRAAKTLFNKPVDPIALNLPDYFDVIKRPMDLSTIYTKFDANKAPEGLVYTSPLEVLRDVNLIWSNCYLYNCRETDRGIRDICDTAKAAFEQKWVEAGFSLNLDDKSNLNDNGRFNNDAYCLVNDFDRQQHVLVDEDLIPSHFSFFGDDLELCLRFLDKFSISAKQNELSDDNLKKHPLVSIEEINKNKIDLIQVTGYLVLPTQLDKDAKLRSKKDILKICLKNILDWNIQYGPIPGLWIRTTKAWYKLLIPSKKYSELLSVFMNQFLLCQRCVNIFSNKTYNIDNGLADQIVNHVANSNSWFLNQNNIEFAKNQLNIIANGDYQKDLICDNSDDMEIETMIDMVEEKEINSSSEQPKNSPFEENTLQNYENKKHVYTCMSDSQSNEETKNKRLKKSDSESSMTSHSLTTLNQSFTKKSLNNSKLMSKSSNEISSYNEEEEEVNSELSDKYQELRLERKLMSQEESILEYIEDQTEAATATATATTAPPPPIINFRVPEHLVADVLSLWDFISTFNKALQLPLIPLWRLEAAICPCIPGYGQEDCLEDCEGLASGAILRDIHISLIRTIENKMNFKSNGQATLEDCKGETEHWTKRLTQFLLLANQDDINNEIKDYGNFLLSHDYIELPAQARLKILLSLIDMAVCTEIIREHINMMTEHCIKSDRIFDNDYIDKNIVDDETLNDKEKEMRLNASRWHDWVMTYRCVSSNQIGKDFLGRNYYVFGNEAEIFKIFVQIPEDNEQHKFSILQSKKDIWGYYEGNNILKLKEWLEKSQVEMKGNVLNALLNFPKVVTLTSKRNMTSSPNSSLNIRYVEHDNTEIDYKEYIKDGYDKILAPLLKGEVENINLKYNSSLLDRIVSCVISLLTHVPFWAKETPVKNAIAHTIQALQDMHSPAELASNICTMEKLLFDSHMLNSNWTGTLRHSWRNAMLYTLNLTKVTALLLTLQQALLPDRFRVTKSSFVQLAQNVKCSLFLPEIKNTVVFLKTGCFIALKKYLLMAQQSHNGIVYEKDDVRVAIDVAKRNMKDYQLAVKSIKNLDFSEKFKILTIAYRTSHYMTFPEESVPILNQYSPLVPCMWLLMIPVKSQINPMPRKQTSIAIPIHIDHELADYFVKSDIYESRMRKLWNVGERFKMLFGGKAKGSNSGIYYKGTVIETSYGNSDSHMNYDAWESLTVSWDEASDEAIMKVSPWELEEDPEEQRQLEEDRRKAEESKARAARALRTARGSLSTPTTPIPPPPQQQQQQQQQTVVPENERNPPNVNIDPDYDPEIEDIPYKQIGRRKRRQSSATEEPVYQSNLQMEPVPQEVLLLLPDSKGFNILIQNFMKRLKGKFKCPIFAGQELNLHKVFHEVQNRGGYQRVTHLKLWKEVCRTLNVDLKGQTSASYNMRLNYEKCLLEFERYLSSGTYQKELEAKIAPSSTELDISCMNGSGGRSANKIDKNYDKLQFSDSDAAMEHMASDEFPELFGAENPESWIRPGVGLLNTVHPPVDTASYIREYDNNLHFGTGGAPCSLNTTHNNNNNNNNTRRNNISLEGLGWSLVGSDIWTKQENQWLSVYISNYDANENKYCFIYNRGLPHQDYNWYHLNEFSEISIRNPNTNNEDLIRCSASGSALNDGNNIESQSVNNIMMKQPPQTPYLTDQISLQPGNLQEFGRSQTSLPHLNNLNIQQNSFTFAPMDWLNLVVQANSQSNVTENNNSIDSNFQQSSVHISSLPAVMPPMPIYSTHMPLHHRPYSENLSNNCNTNTDIVQNTGGFYPGMNFGDDGGAMGEMTSLLLRDDPPLPTVTSNMPVSSSIIDNSDTGMTKSAEIEEMTEQTIKVSENLVSSPKIENTSN